MNSNGYPIYSSSTNPYFFGETTTINTQDLIISDNCIILGADNPSDISSSCVSFEYNSSGTKKWSGLGRDKTTHQFYLYKDSSSEINAGTSIADLVVGTLNLDLLSANQVSGNTVRGLIGQFDTIDSKTQGTNITLGSSGGNANLLDVEINTNITGTLNVDNSNGLVPEMSSNNTPLPIIISSSSASSPNLAYRAFSSTPNFYWKSGAVYTSGLYTSTNHLSSKYGEWIRVDLNNSQVVRSYLLEGTGTGVPYKYTLMAAVDDTLTTVWQELDSQYTDANGSRIYIDNTSSYRYYAIVVEKLSSGTAAEILTFQIYSDSINAKDIIVEDVQANDIKVNTISQKDNGNVLSLTAPIDTVNMTAITHGLTIVNNGYFGACYDPINNFVIFAPHADYTAASGYVYYDCNDQTYKRSAIPSFTGAMVSTAYIQACYHPVLRRIYFGPYSQNAQTYWHYFNCDTATFVDYAHGLSTATFSGCAGIVYSPVNQSLYMIPFGMCNRSQWIKINNVGSASLYTHGLGTALAVNSYNGAVYDPENNRIYLAPYARASSDTWHYIDCATDLLVEYTHGKGAAFFTANDFTFGCYNPYRKTVHWNQFGASDLVSWYYLNPNNNTVYEMVQETPISGNYAYNGEMVYAPNQKRIYPIPSGDADYAYLHYINCVDNTVQVINNPITAVNDAYAGGAYSPLEGRVIMCPLGQSDETNYHVFECLSIPTTSLNINYDNTITIPSARLVAYNFYMPMGEALLIDNATATTITAINTWTKVAGTYTAGIQMGFLTSTNKLIYNETRFCGMAHVGCTFSCVCETTNDSFELAIYKNSTIISGSKISFFLDSSTKYRSSAIHCMTMFDEIGTDYIELYVRNISGSGDITVNNMNLFCMCVPSGSTC